MYGPTAKSHQGASTLLGELLLGSAMLASAKSPVCGTCYQEYAIRFRDAILSSDLTELRQLINNESLSSDDDLRLFLGSEDEPRFKKFFTRNATTIIVESSHEENVDRATIYFIRTSKVPKHSGVSNSFITKLKAFSDFLPCSVESSKGVITMVENLCYLKTDVWDGEQYGINATPNLHPKLPPQIHITHLLISKQINWCALGEDAAVVHDVGAVADAERFADVVIGDQDADAAVLQVPHDALDVANGDWVDAGERFVEQDETRSCGQRACNFDATAFAAG